MESLLGPAPPTTIAPDKLPVKRLRTSEEAGKQGVSVYNRNLELHRKNLRRTGFNALRAIRDLHQQYGLFQERHKFTRSKPENPHAQAGLSEQRLTSRTHCRRSIADGREVIFHASAKPFRSGRTNSSRRQASMNWGGVSPLTPPIV